MNARHQTRVTRTTRSALEVVVVSGLLLALGCAGQQPEAQTAAPAATEATQPEPTAPPQPTAAATPAAQVAPPVPAGPMIVKDGIATPESVLYVPDEDIYLVSNINGSPIEQDDNGFISKLSPEGKVLELKWIDGAKDNVKLNAPKGTAIVGGILYVSDIDTVRKFDAKTGEPKGDIAIKGATFLNDIAAGADGTIYVTDSGVKPGANGFDSTGTDAVYKIVKDKPKSIIKSKDLKGPNGLLVDDSGVWVVSLLGNELYNVKSGKKTDVKQLPKGGLDGFIKTNDGKLLITSWEASAVFRGSPTEEFTPVITDVKGPADIGYDSKRNVVLVPLFMDNGVQYSPL